MKLKIWQVWLAAGFYMAFAAYQYWELYQLEQGTVDSVLMWAPLITLYEAYGKLPVAIVMSIPGWVFAYVLYRIYVHKDVRK